MCSQSGLTPDSLTTLVHFAVSVLTKAANAAGVVPTASTPCAFNFSCLSGARSEHPIPRVGVVAGDAGLGDGRDIRSDVRAFRSGDAQAAQLSRIDQRQ